ncbi:uncharacterized protein LOC132946302 [Metopolophium dirhodum]|uniref:uncharacterized protein LOC132946301 n=1 Tax=Metopolophium dirhodum TaxID=44670 RepID=UPI00298FDC2D|nr:uncharacterized protein LOC132946301 [Metopolophium dirhodum]XP_060872204.1 uncharacterized protein LOC132946302 [Metopolophium dirhodum]
MHKCIVCGNRSIYTNANRTGVIYHGCATQCNDVETGNNVILPMEQNILREENIENTVVNFKSPRRSPKLSRNNEDMTIAEKTAAVVELRRRMAEMKNLQRTLAL